MAIELARDFSEFLKSSSSRPWVSRRESVELGTQPVWLIGLSGLKENKRTAGRHKDIDDLEHLP